MGFWFKKKKAEAPAEAPAEAGGETVISFGRYLHPQGKRFRYMTGYCGHIGNQQFKGQCKVNDDAFKAEGEKFFITNDFRLVSTSVNDIDYGAARNGGIIALVSNSVPCKALFDKAMEAITAGTFRGFDVSSGQRPYIGSIAAGKFFHGSFCPERDNKYMFPDIFDKNSPCLEVRGISSGDLIDFAKYLCKEFGLRMALVMNYNYYSEKGGCEDKFYAVVCDNKADYFTLKYGAEMGGRVINSSGHVIGNPNYGTRKLFYVKSGASGERVTAKADQGYRFDSWSDGVKTAERIDEFVTSDIAVLAQFSPISYERRYEAGPGGTLLGGSPQILKVWGQWGAKTIVAVPDEGYEFVSWSDGEKSVARKDVGFPIPDFCVTAIFAPVT